jgi:RNA polymerase subunit RPABC4/transcription elongation factor Spt4
VNLKPCPDCGHNVSKDAAACPGCGRKIPQGEMFVLWMVVGVIIVGLAIVLAVVVGVMIS